MDLYEKLNQRMADKLQVPSSEDCLPGHNQPLITAESHFVSGAPLAPPFPQGYQRIVLALGCFWGAERKFWQLEGVYTTAVGYAGGGTRNPNYDEVCSGQTGHTEVVLVVFNPEVLALEQVLACFWESHNPTHGMRQGNDVGTQYRSAIYFSDDQQEAVVRASLAQYQAALVDGGFGTITTEIAPAKAFYYAEEYHQQYLAKNPNGYCGLGGTGVKCV